MTAHPATHFCLLPPFPGLGSGSQCRSPTWFSKPTSTPPLGGTVPPGPLPGHTAGPAGHSGACSLSLGHPGAVWTCSAPLPSWTTGSCERRPGLEGGGGEAAALGGSASRGPQLPSISPAYCRTLPRAPHPSTRAWKWVMHTDVSGQERKITHRRM